MTKEEQFVEYVLNKTRTNKILWCFPKCEDGLKLSESYSYYFTKLIGDDDIMLAIGKNINRENFYIFIALIANNIAFALTTYEMEKKYTLRALYDCAAERVNNRLIDKMSSIIDKQEGKDKAQ